MNTSDGLQNLQLGEPESALADIRREFLARLKESGERRVLTQLKGGKKQLSARRARLSKGLEKNSPFLVAWLSGLRDHAGDDQEARENLEVLKHRLEQKQQWTRDELHCLLGLQQGGKLPSLVGFSLMRVSKNYHEIYYADILSSILPKATIDFIKASVSVPRVKDGHDDAWAGSVGQAIKKGEHDVPNSFRDTSGVVASEDLIGGNVSILMRCVYKDSSFYDEVKPKKQTPQDVIAVVFCFFPLAGIFEPADLKSFSKAVDSCAYSIRSYCEHKDAHGNKLRLMKLMQQDHHASSQQSMTAKDFLRTLVTPGTQNNPVGAVMGMHYQIEAERAFIKSIAVCEGFIERQAWFPEFLESATSHDASMKHAIYFERRNKRWGQCTLFLKASIRIPEHVLKVPDPVLAALEALWLNFETTSDQPVRDPKSPDLNEYGERFKIAGDMMLALMSQLLNFLALSLSSKRDEILERKQQTKGNIQQILTLAQLYSSNVSREQDSEGCLESLEVWASSLRSAIGNSFVLVAGRASLAEDLDIDARLRGLWQGGVPFAKIYSDNWDEWLGNLLGLAEVQIPVDQIDNDDDCFSTQISELSKSLIKRLGVCEQVSVRLTAGQRGNLQGLFRLCSVVPLIGYEDLRDSEKLQIDHSKHNPIISLVSSYYSSILLERDKAKADQDVLLAQYARGASHGLKNALEVPHLVLQIPLTQGQQNLVSLGETLATRDYLKVQGLLEASNFVLEEVQHLKEQAELFFYVMDPKKARERIEKRAESLEATSVNDLVKKAFLRGLYLTIRTRLSDDALESAMVTNGKDSTAEQVRKVFQNEINQSLIDANNALLDDGIKRLRKNIAQRTCLDFSLFELPEELKVEGINILLLDAVLMELSQNATKAAFLSIPDIKKANQRPFFKLEVSPEQDFIAINISNSANDSDRDQLLEANEAAQPQRNAKLERVGGGIQGIWQVRMLCDQLSRNLELDEHPTVNGNSVCFTLRWFTSSRR
jgi:hypothetical protein